MKSSNLKNGQEEIISKRGVAQTFGYVNRREYRKSLKQTRKTRNTSKDQVLNFIIGRNPWSAPYPIDKKRKKLKGWQKNMRIAG